MLYLHYEVKNCQQSHIFCYELIYIILNDVCYKKICKHCKMEKMPVDWFLWGIAKTWSTSPLDIRGQAGCQVFFGLHV